MKRVLVTGASGFIGRHSLEFLVERGYEVHAVSSREPVDINVNLSVTWHRADLLQRDTAATLFARVQPTHLLHFAWYAEHGKFWTATENLLWVAATLRLLQTFVEARGTRAVLAGTCAEYDWHYGLCSELFTPCNPATLYGASKYATRIAAEAWAHQHNVSLAWGRVFFLYGPHEHPRRLVRSVIESLLQDKPAKCTAGTQLRDVMHVQDVAAAFAAVLDGDVTGPVNIASGQPCALKDIVLTIGEQLHRTGLIELGAIPMPVSDPASLYADISRLRNEAGFTPRFDLAGGIAHAINWTRQHIALP